jgi:hypothetical protein
VIPFPKGEAELGGPHEEIERVVALVGARSLLIMGFANDLRDLDSNLKLAERRARAVAEYLQARGIRRERIIVAGSEAAHDDEGGSRVEVMLVPEPEVLVQSAWRSCVLPDRIADALTANGGLWGGTSLVGRQGDLPPKGAS